MAEEEHDEEYSPEDLQKLVVVCEERISGLPLDILVHILSLLDTKDAAKTSILSHHWRYLWLRVPGIKLEYRNIFGSNDYNVTELSTFEAFNDYQIQFIRCADCIIEQYRRRGPSTIRSLQVAFFLDGESPVYPPILDKWLGYAIQARAEKIELLPSRFAPTNDHICIGEKYKVNDCLFSEVSLNRSTLKHLSLEACLVYHIHGDLGGLRNLTSLKLEYVSIRDDFMTHLFSTALLLRDLSLHSCSFSERKFHLINSSVTHFEHHYPRDEIKISSPNLTTFNFCGNSSVLSLLEAPSLSKLTFWSWDSVHQPRLLARLHKLENLTLYIVEPLEHEGKDIYNITKVSFTSLKLLELVLTTYEVGDLSWFPTIFKCSPVLQKLVLELRFPQIEPEKVAEKKLEMQKPARFTHNQLKEVDIGGCRGFWFEIEIVKFLFEVAVNLERMVFGPKKKVFHRSGEWVDVRPGGVCLTVL